MESPRSEWAAIRAPRQQNPYSLLLPSKEMAGILPALVRGKVSIRPFGKTRWVRSGPGPVRGVVKSNWGGIKKQVTFDAVTCFISLGCL